MILTKATQNNTLGKEKMTQLQSTIKSILLYIAKSPLFALLLGLNIGVMIGVSLMTSFVIYEKIGDKEFFGYKNLDVQIADLPRIDGLEYNLLRIRQPEPVAEITKENIDYVQKLVKKCEIATAVAGVKVGNYVGYTAQPSVCKGRSTHYMLYSKNVKYIQLIPYQDK